MDKVYAERLKELRRGKGLTQEELSQKIGISRARYGNYETGFVEPNLEILEKLSLFYGVSVDYLIGIKDNLNYDMFLNSFTNLSKTQQESIIHIISEFQIVNM